MVNKLRTDFKDVVWKGKRKFVQLDNGDNTVSFEDVTSYRNKEFAHFGAGDVNNIGNAVNDIVEQAQMFKLTDDFGSAKFLQSVDLNELTESGMYYIIGMTNGVSGIHYAMIEVVSNGKECIQTLTSMTDGARYWRIVSPNVSKTWHNVASKSDIDTEYVDIINCNSLPEQKLYYIASARNCFASNYVYVYNGYMANTGSAFQYGFDVFNNRFGFRTFVQGVWKAWKTW